MVSRGQQLLNVMFFKRGQYAPDGLRMTDDSRFMGKRAKAKLEAAQAKRRKQGKKAYLP